FESGRLINAFSDDFGAEGEAAAYDILTWSRTAIEFERLPEGVRRTIDMPTQTLLIEVARRQDEQREREARLTPPTPMPSTPDRALDAPAPGGDPMDAPDERWDAPNVEGPTEGTTTAALDGTAEDPPPHEPAPAPESESESELDVEPEPEWAAAAEPALVEPIAIDAAGDPSPEAEHEPERAAVPAPAASRDASNAATPTDEPPAAPPEPPTDAAQPPPSARAHAELVAAIERLTQRVHAADAALAEVADEVDAFQAAQRRYDDEIRRQEERRRAVEEARRDVADLARQILARMDGLFEAFDGDAPVGPVAADADPGDRSNA
ncbi:MAG: DUF4388 domain-containing protein, partial [Trueperaceae bacterium]